MPQPSQASRSPRSPRACADAQLQPGGADLGVVLLVERVQPGHPAGLHRQRESRESRESAGQHAWVSSSSCSSAGQQPVSSSPRQGISQRRRPDSLAGDGGMQRLQRAVLGQLVQEADELRSIDRGKERWRAVSIDGSPNPACAARGCAHSACLPPPTPTLARKVAPSGPPAWSSSP